MGRLKKILRLSLPAFMYNYIRSFSFYLNLQKGLKHWNDYTNEDLLFRPPENESEMMKVFKKYVSVVHLEISNYCNRSCTYCTNSLLECRSNEKHFLPESLFMKSVNDLAKIGYDQFIEFNGFNEPLADRDILLKRIYQLKTALPESKLLINSNGDYLNGEYLDDISKRGVDYMMVTLHLNSNELNLSAEQRSRKASEFIKRFPFISFVFSDNGQFYKAKVHNMEMIVRVSDFYNNGHNFGGTVKEKKKRKLPCYVPVKHIYVDYAGRVNLCCSANMDSDDFADLIIGDVSKSNLFELFSSRKALKLRKALKNIDWDIPACCRFCNAQLDYFAIPETTYAPYYPFFMDTNLLREEKLKKNKS